MRDCWGIINSKEAIADQLYGVRGPVPSYFHPYSVAEDEVIQRASFALPLLSYGTWLLKSDLELLGHIFQVASTVPSGLRHAIPR